MKPYSKTFRKHKDHKAKDCALCAERIVPEGNTATRTKVKNKLKGMEDEA